MSKKQAKYVSARTLCMTLPNHLAEPLELGDIHFANRVFLAPMSGISDLPMRERSASHGAGMVVSEMIASRELVTDRAESRMRLQRGRIAIHVVQLAGRAADWMAEATRIACGEGADIIDINMGCPAKKVTGGYSGSALMRDLDHAVSLIDATIAASTVPVSVKMRLGWDDNSINAPELARRAESSGVAMLTVHGRTRCQFYTGQADWTAIRQVKNAVNIPLVANGDVGSLDDARKILKLSGADAVMIGRQHRGRPWLAGEIAAAAAGKPGPGVPRTGAQIRDYVIGHYGDMLAFYGSEIGTRQARKHLGWYMDRFAPDSTGAQRQQIMTGKEPVQVIHHLRQLPWQADNADLLDVA